MRRGIGRAGKPVGFLYAPGGPEASERKLRTLVPRSLLPSIVAQASSPVKGRLAGAPT